MANDKAVTGDQVAPPGPARPGPSKERGRRWRTPAIVAAAVIAIAVATSAALTHGFGIGEHHASAGDGESGPVTASAGCPFSSGEGFGASDTGFDAGGIEFSTGTSGSAVCFFDGVSTWNLPRGDGPLVADITGVGTLVPMTADAKSTKARYVWGVLGDAAASIHLAVGASGAKPVDLSTVAPGVRIFYAEVPAAGSVTVTAQNADGTVIATRVVG